jgi:antibiotic biosynthesis monooxygenase (ABM) superfamily enzyme
VGGRPPWWWPHLAAAMGLLADAAAWGVVSTGFNLAVTSLNGGATSRMLLTAFALGTVFGAAKFWLERRGIRVQA